MKSFVVIDAVVEKCDQLPEVVVKRGGFYFPARSIFVSGVNPVSAIAFDMDFLDLIEKLEFRELLAQKFGKPAF